MEDWTDYVNPETHYDPSRAQLIIDHETMQPTRKIGANDIVITTEGIFVINQAATNTRLQATCVIASIDE